MQLLAKTWKLIRSAVPAVLFVVAGVLIYVFLIRTAPKPIPDDTRPAPRLVRVFRAEKGTRRLATTAYGTSRASQDWTAIAEVSGRAVAVDERFESGEILPAGSVLIEIDRTDYALAEERLLAEIKSQEAQIAELEQNEENLRRIADLQAQLVSVAEDQLKRLKGTPESSAVAKNLLDTAESTLLGYRTSWQETQNQLELMPVRRRLLETSLEASNVQLRQARRNLEKCSIVLAFDARCASKAVEVGQFVTVGERLGCFLALEKAEVVAMVEPRKVRALFPRGIEELGTLDLTEIDLGESLFKKVEVPAEVRWGSGETSRVWHGRVARLASGLDPATRTIPVIVEVPNPYKDFAPGVRPPLVPDLFCEVTFKGALVDGVVIVPRDCLQEAPALQGSASASASPNGAEYCVYLLREGQLHVAKVGVLVLEKDHAVIERGIEGGDMVILTDLFPAAEGMALEGQLDEGVTARMRAALLEGVPAGARLSEAPPAKEGAP